jgi:integrase
MAGKSRATYGQGAKPYQRSDGLWVARIEGGYTDSGTRKRIAVSAKTEAECKRRVKEKQREIALRNGRITSAKKARTTVKTWADEWLPIYRNEVKPTVYATNSSLVRRWIVPTIGAQRLADLTPAHVRSLHRAIKNAGRSSTTANHASVLLMRMLRAATLDGYDVPPNLFEVTHPALAVNDREAIPTADARRLLAVAREHGDYTRWLGCILNGLRRGEALGLTWDCVDFNRRVIDVSWQLQRLPYEDKRDRSKGFLIPDGYEARHLHLALHLVRPKTPKSWRVIPLVPWLHGELMAARQTWTPNPWGLVWAGTDRTGAQTPRRFRDDLDEWETLQHRAGISHPAGRPYHLHEARNTTATILLEEGVDEAVITAILGHSSIVTSRGYMTVSTDLSMIALEKVARALGAEDARQIGG